MSLANSTSNLRMPKRHLSLWKCGWTQHTHVRFSSHNCSQPEHAWQLSCNRTHHIYGISCWLVVPQRILRSANCLQICLASLLMSPKTRPKLLLQMVHSLYGTHGGNPMGALGCRLKKCVLVTLTVPRPSWTYSKLKRRFLGKNAGAMKIWWTGSVQQWTNILFVFSLMLVEGIGLVGILILSLTILQLMNTLGFPTRQSNLCWLPLTCLHVLSPLPHSSNYCRHSRAVTVLQVSWPSTWKLPACALAAHA